MALSTAITPDRVSAISGYEVKISQKGVSAGNLPQRIDVFAEKSSTHQTAEQFLLTTSAYEVGLEYGFNSPLYAVARILRPKSGGKLQSIPTYFWGIDEAVGAVAKAIPITVSGTATSNATHTLRINGRTSLDGIGYSFTVVTGDTDAEVCQKIVDVCNNVLGCPVKATISTATATFTAGWKGETSNQVTVEVLTNGNAAGMTYTEGSVTAGAGQLSISDVQNLGSAWSTFLLNGLNNTDGVLDYLETFNGNIETKTGRYAPSVFLPFHAVTGTSIDTLAELKTEFGEDRGTEMTNIIAVAPNTPCFDFEIAADYIYNYVPIAQATPAQCVYNDPSGRYLSNIIVPEDGNIGDFGDDDMRDFIVKAGFCTAKLTGGKYEILDFVTTRNVPEYPQTSMPYRWVRDNTIVFNMKYALKFYEDIFVKGKIIIGDTQIIDASNTVSPASYTSVLETQYFPDLINRALILSFSDLQVAKGDTNPNRFETYFESTITSIARVQSTTMSISNNF